MLINYLKIAWRNLWNNKVYGFINIAGLTFGLTCCVFILLWVANEKSFNRSHEKLPRIYQVYEHQHYANQNIFTVTATPGPLADALKQEIPGIEKAAWFSWRSEKLFTIGEGQGVKFEGHYANNDAFSVFSFPFVEGNAAQALTRPNDIVITRKMAESLFGKEKAVGKSIRVDGKDEYMVSGVMENVPDNSTFKFDWLMPRERIIAENKWLEGWDANAPRTYVLVAPNVDIDQMNKKVKGIIGRHKEKALTEVLLYPFKDTYLQGRFENGVATGGRIEYVRLFIIIAIFVLLIACINFMNLSTARAVQRSKEVGVRKSIGAGRGSLISQFLGESFALVLIATSLSVLAVWTLLPAFEKMVNVTLSVKVFTWYNILVLLLLAVFTGFIAGSYPAFYLSSLNPVATLKTGMLRLRASAIWLRKGLVIFQFVISTVLIVGAFLVYQQVSFIKNRNLGLNKDQVVFFLNEGNISQNIQPFKHALLGMPGIVASTEADQLPISIGNNGQGISWPGKNEDDAVLFDKLWAGYDLQETMQLQMVEGRTFSAAYPSDAKGVVINETAAKLMGLKRPYVGTLLDVEGTQTPIIGVTKDFSTSHLEKKVAPLVIRFQPDGNKLVLVRIKPDQVDKAVASIESVYKQFNPQYPFSLRYMDESFLDMYRSEQVIGRLAACFTILAIFIACLGLFGLATFTAQQRTKEIGIRKVLGASVMQILTLLSKDFIRLVLLAIAIGMPLAAYFMHGWLEKFAYHVDVAWWVFAVTGVLALLLAMVTVSYQSIKAARMNPVRSLRTE